jgi:hypothetical protein
MEREILLIRDGETVWRGQIKLGDKAAPASVQEYFLQAWRKALEAGVVVADDAGRVQFRIA